MDALSGTFLWLHLRYIALWQHISFASEWSSSMKIIVHVFHVSMHTNLQLYLHSSVKLMIQTVIVKFLEPIGENMNETLVLTDKRQRPWGNQFIYKLLTCRSCPQTSHGLNVSIISFPSRLVRRCTVNTRHSAFARDLDDNKVLSNSHIFIRQDKMEKRSSVCLKTFLKSHEYKDLSWNTSILYTAVFIPQFYIP